MFPRSSVFPTNAGRTGLALALTAFRALRPGKTEVLVPAYICPSVVTTVTDCGLKPVFVGVQDDLNMDPADAAAQISEATLALIAVHMYAAPARIEELEGLCRNAGIYMIDDAAQVFGVTVAGRPLGAFGDVGILSFAQSKTIVAGLGGALIVNDEASLASLSEGWRALPDGGRGWGIFLSFLIEFQWERWTRLPLYYWKNLRSWREEPEPARTLPRTGIGAVQAGLALAQIRSAATRILGKTQVTQRFQDALGRVGLTLSQYRPSVYLARIMVDLPSGADREEVKSSLARRGIQCRRPYPPLGSTAGLKARVDHMLELPSHSRMTDADIADLCDALGQTLHGCQGEMRMGSL